MFRHLLAGVFAGLTFVQFCGCHSPRGNLAACLPPEPRNQNPVTEATALQSWVDALPLAAASGLGKPCPSDITPTKPSTAGAAEPAAEAFSSVCSEAAAPWTLASLESIALENNPSIREAASSARKAIGFRDQVGKKPNPLMGYNATQLADRGTDQHTVFIEQQVVLGGKLLRNQDVLNQEIKSQLWEVEAQRYRVLTDVRQRYFEALAAQRRLALIKEFSVIAAKGVEVAKMRRDAKEGSTPEVLQAEIQLSQVEVQRSQVEAEFRGAWRQLTAMAGLQGVPAGTLDGTLPNQVEMEDLSLVAHETLTASPELQAAQARVSRALSNIRRQEAHAVPNVTFMLASGVDRGADSGMINAQVGLPIPIYNRNEGNIAAAQAEFSQAREELRRIELSIESRIAKSWQEYEAAAAVIQQYQRVILPKAQETLALTEEAYAAGELEFLQVLTVRKTYFDTNLEYVLALRNFAVAETHLQGMVLSGGLDGTRGTDVDSGLREQSLSGE